MNAEIVHRLDESFQLNVATQGLLQSNLLNFQLSAELLKHNPRMITLVSHLMTKLFENDTVRDKVFAMAEEGDEIAVMARDTALNKLPGILEDVKVKMRAIIDEATQTS